MLILTRKKDEAIIIGDDIEIIITEVYEDRVKIGIRAPKNMKVFRKELILALEDENKSSAVGNSIDLRKLKEIIKK